jgi:hypothetical protein
LEFELTHSENLKIKAADSEKLKFKFAQTNQSHNKRSLQQTLIEEHKKKLKAPEKSPVLHFK